MKAASSAVISVRQNHSHVSACLSRLRTTAKGSLPSNFSSPQQYSSRRDIYTPERFDETQNRGRRVVKDDFFTFKEVGNLGVAAFVSKYVRSRALFTWRDSARRPTADKDGDERSAGLMIDRDLVKSFTFQQCQWEDQS